MMRGYPLEGCTCKSCEAMNALRAEIEQYRGDFITTQATIERLEAANERLRTALSDVQFNLLYCWCKCAHLEDAKQIIATAVEQALG